MVPYAIPARSHAPPAQAGECATFNVTSGRWGAKACTTAHAVVCCSLPPVDHFSCSRGVTEDSAEWPIVPFYYGDDNSVDDIPNTLEEIAEGFSNANAYFIGNKALSELKLNEAQLCLEDTAAKEKKLLCRTLNEGMLAYTGDLDERLTDTWHTMIAILSGQLSPTGKNQEVSFDNRARARPLRLGVPGSVARLPFVR